MKFLIKYLLKFHREIVLNEVVHDYFGEIPNKVTDPAITILDEKKQAIARWIQYQAFHLQRRMVQDPAKAQILFGMMLELKIMNQMLTGGRTIIQDTEGIAPASKAEEERERREQLEKDLQGAATFTAGKK